jgi:hypothetical protein
MTRQRLVNLAFFELSMSLYHRTPDFPFFSASSLLIPTNAWNKAAMFCTIRQLALVLAIAIISSLPVMPLVSFVRDIRSYSDLEAPGIAFILTPDHA